MPAIVDGKDYFGDLVAAMQALAREHRIVSHRATGHLFPVCIRPMRLTTGRDRAGNRTVTLDVRADFDWRARSGIPVRAYVRVTAHEPDRDLLPTIDIRPGRPTSMIEVLLDVIWFGIILLPISAFLHKFLRFTSIRNGLELSIFLLLLAADRMATLYLCRRANTELDAYLTQSLETASDDLHSTKPGDLQDWISDLRQAS